VTGYETRKKARLAQIIAVAARGRAAEPGLADICRRHGARRVRLFGSLVTGRYGETPDVDLAVDGVPADRFFDVLAMLQIEASPLEVNLVDMADAPSELRERIEAERMDR
jgi:predicted nucleotidyltransferase